MGVADIALPMHGIGGRGDLPVPLWLAMYSAGAAVAVSFFALTAFWPHPRYQPSVHRALVTRRVGARRALVTAAGSVADARVTRWLLKATGMLALGALLVTAWAGSDSAADNPAPTWFYVWMWVGIIPVSLVFGPVWRLINPLRTLAAAGRRIVHRPDGLRPLPAGISVWPAVAGLAVFLWLELAVPDSSDPRVVAAFGTSYTVLNVAAGIVFGTGWFRAGDAFEVYGELLAKASPWGRDQERRIVPRNPLAGLAAVPPSAGTVVLVCVLLGSTAFDGISRWSAWTNATADLGRGGHLGVYTAGLVAAVTVVGVVFVVAAHAGGAGRLTGSAARRVAGGGQAWLGPAGGGGLPGQFAHSLVPIVIGYAIAHYFSFAVFQGQAGVLLASDPLGRGWDLLGLAGARIDYGLVSTSLIAEVQVGAIVLGHVLGVVSAHDRAIAVFRRKQLRRAQYPLLAAMVAFTAGGIALVAGS